MQRTILSVTNCTLSKCLSFIKYIHSPVQIYYHIITVRILVLIILNKYHVLNIMKLPHSNMRLSMPPWSRCIWGHCLGRGSSCLVHVQRPTVVDIRSPIWFVSLTCSTCWQIVVPWLSGYLMTFRFEVDRVSPVRVSADSAQNWNDNRTFRNIVTLSILSPTHISVTFQPLYRIHLFTFVQNRFFVIYNSITYLI